MISTQNLFDGELEVIEEGAIKKLLSFIAGLDLLPGAVVGGAQTHK